MGSVANIGRSIRSSNRDTIGSTIMDRGNLGSAINSGGDSNSSASNSTNNRGTIDITTASTHPAYEPAELGVGVVRDCRGGHG